jgi:hypothetical protein
MTTSTENNKIKNKEMTDTTGLGKDATLEDGNKLDKKLNFKMASTGNSKDEKKKDEEMKDTSDRGKDATLKDGKKLDMMTAGNEKNDEEVVVEEKSDTFDPESMLEEGKLGSTGIRKRGGNTPRSLSVVSKLYDVDGDGKLDAAELAMREMDSEDRGYLTNEKVYKVMQEQMKLQQEVFGLKRMSLVLLAVIVLLSVATLGTSFAAATLAKDTNVVNGNLVGKSDGSLVATRSRGSQVVATVDASYLERRRRRKLGFETADDRRFLQQEGGEIVATVSTQAIVDAFSAWETDGTPIAVSVLVTGTKHTELVSGSGLSVSEEVDETWYRGLHAQEIPEPTYNVHCVSDASTCNVYMIGQIGDSGRRLASGCSVYETEAACDRSDGDVCTWKETKCDCFSSVATVSVLGKGVVAMQDLQVGDKVLSANNRFQTVYTFTHMHRTKTSGFLQIYTEESETPLELSPKHMLFLEGKVNPLPALLVKVGDAVAGANGPRVVTDIRSVVREGFYAPHTTDGTIMVDGILASTHTSFQGTEYLEAFGVKTLSHQTFHDFLAAPFRKFCMLVSIDLCNKYTDEDGYNLWDHLGKQIVHFCKKQHILVQVAVYGCLTILVLVAYVALSLSVLSVLATLLVYVVVMKWHWKNK